MNLNVILLRSKDPDSPAPLRNETGETRFNHLWAIGNIEVLKRRLVGFLCSARCPRRGYSSDIRSGPCPE